MFDIIDAGPGIRRNLLDWGMFHVEHSYHALWKDYRRVLKQRNMLLRQKAPHASFIPWDKLLVELSEALHNMRQTYCETWFSLFELTLKKLSSFSCNLVYIKGWDRRGLNKPLMAILKDQFEMDLSRQFTHSGAHQADILFEASQLKAKQELSRGQQKIVLMALRLSQAQLLNIPCIYLLDDITSELDNKHIDKFLSILSDIKGQFFFTSMNPNVFQSTFDHKEVSYFMMENGIFSAFENSHAL
jgi:DNA replication and repair protein RecF